MSNFSQIFQSDTSKISNYAQTNSHCMVFEKSELLRFIDHINSNYLQDIPLSWMPWEKYGGPGQSFENKCANHIGNISTRPDPDQKYIRQISDGKLKYPLQTTFNSPHHENNQVKYMERDHPSEYLLETNNYSFIIFIIIGIISIAIISLWYYNEQNIVPMESIVPVESIVPMESIVPSLIQET